MGLAGKIEGGGTAARTSACPDWIGHGTRQWQRVPSPCASRSSHWDSCVPSATACAAARGSRAMADRDDDFRPRPTPPRDRGARRTPRFISQVLKATSKAGRSPQRLLANATARPGAGLGRGHVAARLAGQSLGPRSRRAIVKARLVVLKRAGERSTQKHLRYIERDGVTREGGRGRLYGPDTDYADGDAFERRCREDRHEFRFILAPEDGNEIGDLRAFTRTHMAQVQRDLGTRLDWVAVDHWDTDDPHTHIVLRGKDDLGADLVIARDYIGHGMRQRAAELATDWLGPRSRHEIERQFVREAQQDRWTTLDQALTRSTRDGMVSLRDVPGDLGRRRHRAQLIGRLQHLAKLGLAERQRGAQWSLHPEAERVLRSLGERGDIIRTMQRRLGKHAHEHTIWDPAKGKPLSGRILASGLSDELHERGYLVVAGRDGRAHYVDLGNRADLSRYPDGAQVFVRPAPRAPDRAMVVIQRTPLIGRSR
ncbi:DUF3363 domain-containing protein [Luteimonas kalidii]|uniref:DUF3363 domain-containing protein n=1 Tax=Luteimonas kalidii TaxID=3042025 RepID=A0ABT6JXB2_9GAMM|nr:DUF3363 domain-containing protein [Luteimonas kalidii]MDH5835343.1 DUF3363 domain-containing protein [Luteimonas kalidii]